MNRWWTLILTLCLACAFAASISARASADGRMLDELGGRNWSSGDGSGPPPSSGDGDPDTPTPSSIKMARPVAVSTPRVAGDGARVDSVMMWHFRVVMQSLRLWGFGRF
jgi:hypothetical protein